MRLASKLMTGAGVLALSSGFAAAAPAVVQNDLNLRAGPGVEFPVVAAMPGGSRVNVIGCEASWCRVAFAGTMGFASRGFLAIGGPVATLPAYGGASYAYGGYAPGGYYAEGRYGYSPGSTYGYGTSAYGPRYGSYEGARAFGTERRYGESSASVNVRNRSEENMRGGSEQRAAAIKGDNPMRIRASTANPNLPRAQGQATAIKGNNPMRIRASTANPNLPRSAGQATAIKGNNPMRIRASTASSNNASATTGAAPRENNRRRNSP